ncbi:MAG: hypothetical protein R6W96_05795 [Clostridia bacterium]
MARNREAGFGMLEAIVLSGTLLFIILPVFSAMVEKIHVSHLVHRYTEMVEVAATAVIADLRTEMLSEGSVEARDVQNLAGEIRLLMESRLSGWDEIGRLEVDLVHPGEQCSEGTSSPYPFFHILAEFSIGRLNRPEKIRTLRIHRDLEIPLIR